MRKSKIIPPDHQMWFWSMVRKCLHRFHKAPPIVFRRLKELQKEIEKVPKQQFELFFHNEPLYVANDLMGKEIEATEEYLRLRDDYLPKS